MEKYDKGGDVFSETTLEELKKMSPKERKQFERLRAYKEGLKNAEKGPVKGKVSQTIDQALGPQTSGERKFRDKGYEDRKEAEKYKKKKAGGKVKMKKGGMVKKHRGDGCAKRGKTKGRMV